MQKRIDPKIIYPKWLDKRQGNEAENMLAKGLIHTVHTHTQKSQEGNRTANSAFLEAEKKQMSDCWHHQTLIQSWSLRIQSNYALNHTWFSEN